MTQNKIYRYPGLRPFYDNEEDRPLFFGREYETELLFHSILANKLFVLFGKSAMGKTSVINVGLMEKLRNENYLPITISFGDKNITPLNAIYTRIEAVFKREKSEVEFAGFKKICYDPGKKDSLWEYFKTVSFRVDDQSLTPVLILDQFEEFFTEHLSNNREDFTRQLADVVRNRIPKNFIYTIKKIERFPYSESPPRVKIVISIREEFLGSLEEMAQSIPHILHNRFRLMPLTRKQAEEAIVKPARLEQKERFKTEKFLYDPKMLNALLDFLCKQKKMVNPAGEKVGLFKKIWGKIKNFLRHHEEKPETIITDEVEPFQLQLLCKHIEQKVEQKKIKKTDGKIVVTSNDIDENEMEKVMKEFYDELVKKLPISNKEKKKVREFCETGLIWDKRRMSLEEKQIKKDYKISKNILDEMVNNRLLHSEPRVGRVYYELSHDSFVAPILKSRSEREDKKWLRWKIILLVVAVILIFRKSIINSIIIPLLELMKIY
jgi:hypothetical protein